MIHSLAGGSIKPLKFNDFAKVELTEGASSGQVFWYITTIALSEGDEVLVPFGKHDALTRARVLRVDKNISSQCSPVRLSAAKRVYCKVRG